MIEFDGGSFILIYVPLVIFLCPARSIMSAQDVLLGFIGKLNDLKPSLEPDTPPEGEPTPEKWAYQVDQVKRFTTRCK